MKIKDALGPAFQDGKRVIGTVTYSGKEIEGRYMYYYGPEYDWTGKASKKLYEVHFIVQDNDINLPVDPLSIRMVK